MEFSAFFFFFVLMNIFKIFFLSKILKMLITLEFVSITLFFVFYIYQVDNSTFYLMVIILMTLLVVESVLGLCIFLQNMRSRGTDKFRSMRALK